MQRHGIGDSIVSARDQALDALAATLSRCRASQAVSGTGRAMLPPREGAQKPANGLKCFALFIRVLILQSHVGRVFFVRRAQDQGAARELVRRFLAWPFNPILNGYDHPSFHGCIHKSLSGTGARSCLDTPKFCMKRIRSTTCGLTSGSETTMPDSVISSTRPCSSSRNE